MLVCVCEEGNLIIGRPNCTKNKPDCTFLMWENFTWNRFLIIKKKPFLQNPPTIHTDRHSEPCKCVDWLNLITSHSKKELWVGGELLNGNCLLNHLAIVNSGRTN
eukprot:TRINITY_DN8365_c2_g1_i1.p1 TRINITY_DN8365_c2_g1~~TRINITY_DN8365_c2_g1_i1.p1  ORF type:complete len:105 (-),score=3.73 TRINITY_DN8365_c2_g1_i1:717-1031(-)